MSEKYAFWVTLRTQSDHCSRGKAEVRIIDFKTTWSEFKKQSQTAAPEAMLRNVYFILKPHGQSFRRQVRLLLSQSRSQAVVCVSTPRMYPRSGFFLVKAKIIEFLLAN